ncbi:MAG: sugar phosphate isomerase/epimerase family protein [Clostridia bacterium]|nr:sugar phosphate isomerase/epimerase family protein [Clostridia bacterium]
MALIRIGVCVDTDMILEAEQAGYDYIEGNLSQIAVLDKRAFMTQYAIVREAGIRAEVMNCMLPRELNVVGRGVNASMLHEYLDFAFERARMLGCDMCVFASPAVRQVPEGWPIDVAWRQMTNFLRLVERHAAAYGLIVSIEPVCRDECNILNTLREAVMLCSILKLDHIRVTANIYQMEKELEPIGELPRAGELLSHVHICSGERAYPAMEDIDKCKAVFRALNSVNYRRRVSVEAGYDNFREEATNAFEVLDVARKSS